jgi:3-hydroxybutyryl-CoA dehydratase
MECQNLQFTDINRLDSACLDIKIGKQDLEAFVHLTGDKNPLHCDLEFGKNSSFKKNIVHGLLTTSYASTLVGMILPGQNCLILSTNFDFLQPVYLDQELQMIGVVDHKDDLNKTLKIRFSVCNTTEPVISGSILVKVGQNGNFESQPL